MDDCLRTPAKEFTGSYEQPQTNNINMSLDSQALDLSGIISAESKHYEA